MGAWWGGVWGAFSVGARWSGKGDHQGLRYALRFRRVFSLGGTALGILVFLLFGGQLFSLY